MAAVASQNILRAGRHQLAPLAGCYTTQRRGEFTVVKPGDHSNLSAYRRGGGGRSSFSGIVATVFGANGFIGKALVNRLGRIGSQVICPYRGHGYFSKDLRLCGDLGQILFMQYDLRDDESIRKAMKYSNVVINCVGKDYDTRNFDMDFVNRQSAAKIATLAKDMGVERLIHISHLAATGERTGAFLPGGSKFLRSKYFGEQEVLEIFPEATIIRPSRVVGYDDQFTWQYMHMGRRISRNYVAIYNRGRNVIKAPVWQTDLASGILKAIQDSKTKGQIYEAYGPRAYELIDIVRFIIRENRDYSGVIKDLKYLPSAWFRAYRYEKFKSVPPYTLQTLEAEVHSDIITGGPSIEDLGVQLTCMEPVIHASFRTYRMASYKEDEVMDDAMEPEPPVYKYVNKKPYVPYEHHLRSYKEAGI